MRCRWGVGAAAPLCITIKPASPSPSLDCCVAGTLSVPFILSPCNLPFASLSPPGPRLSPPAAPPQPLAGCASHLVSDHFDYDLGPPSILPRSTPLWWPLVLIRPLLDQAFLVGGLANADEAVSAVQCALVAPNWLGKIRRHQQCGRQYGRVELDLEVYTEPPFTTRSGVQAA